MTIKKYHIGLTQWGYKDWTGNFFQEGTRPQDFLREYASVFNSVEGNTTFYRVPSEEDVKRWGGQVPDDFKFCFKFPREITHNRKLQNVSEDVLSFLDRFESIHNKLGPFHIQLSAQFCYEEMDRLELLAERLPVHLSYAIEVRHPDFFDKGKKERHLIDFLKSYGIDRVVFDTRKLHALPAREQSVKDAQKKKPVLPVRFDATGSRPFIRYVGANDVLNNETYLKEWAIITANWIRDGKHPYIFIHAPDALHAPRLARYFHRELSGLIQLNAMPAWPFERKDEQLGLF